MYRITNRMMTNTYLSDLYNNLGRLTDLNRQTSTGKLYDRPSQNPIDVVRDLNLSTTIYENEQYIRNMDDAITWLKNNDQTLGQINEVVQRMRELAIYAGDGALDDAEMNAIATEMNQLRDELMMTSNYSVEGRHLFAGLATNIIPFVKDSEGNVVYKGNLGNVNFEMERTFVGRVSMNGKDVFPDQFRKNSLRSLEVPLDFAWKGRSEIIQIQVGERRVKVRIPEYWTDDNTNGIKDPQDQNLFRDCKELDSFNLDQIAAIMRNSTNMGDVGKLVSVKVVKDTETNTQQLIIKSHTGEPVSVTGWQETDFPIAAPEGEHTPQGNYPRQHNAIFSGVQVGWSGTAQGGSVTFRWGDGDIDTVTYTQADLNAKQAAMGGATTQLEALAALMEDRVPGIVTQVKTDGTNEVLLVQAKDRLATFQMTDMAGDMTAVFPGGNAVSKDVSKFAGVIVPSGDFPVTIGGNSYADVAAVNSAGLGLWAEVRGGETFIYAMKSNAAQAVTDNGGVIHEPQTLFRAPEPDHSHISFASYMHLETAIKSVELPADNSIPAKAAGSVMHLVFESGDRHVELEVPANEVLTLKELADRIRGVGGDWLDAVVMTDNEESNTYDILNRGMANKEDPTQKLVLRTKDGQALTVYDANSATAAHGASLGISTAVYGDFTGTAIPTAANLDPSIPGRISLSVGDETFVVAISREDVAEGVEKVLASIQEQVGKERIGYSIDGTNFALYAKNGEALSIHDIPFCDPIYKDYSAGLAMQWGVQTGIASDAVANSAVAGADGTIRIATPGRSVDISIFAGESLRDVAVRIAENVPWVNVALHDTAPPDLPSGAPHPAGGIQLSITAKDGSAVNIYDVFGAEASTTFEMDTAIKGTADLSGWSAVAGDLLTFEVNGVTHTIDLEQMVGTTDNDAKGLVCLINSRFQGQDLKAELVDANPDPGVDEPRLVISSSRGYDVAITTAPASLGITVPASTPERSGSPVPTPYGQNVTARTHSEETPMDFFGLIDNLTEAVKGQDREGISNVLLSDIDLYMNNLLRCRAETGAFIKRYGTSQDRLTQNNEFTEDLRSKIADTDLAKAITEFNMAQAVYQASLGVIARIVQPTLVDFLR